MVQIQVEVHKQVCARANVYTKLRFTCFVNIQKLSRAAESKGTKSYGIQDESDWTSFHTFVTRPDTWHKVLQNTVFRRQREGVADLRADGRTDRPSYRGASSRLKTKTII